jgi:hypothetical protein
MQGSRLSKFLVQRECMPFPGPPEEKELAVPSSTRSTLYSSILGERYSQPGKATPNSNSSSSSWGTLCTPPSYLDTGRLGLLLLRTTWPRGTFGVSLGDLGLDGGDGGGGVLEVGEGDDGAVGGEELALEVEELLVGEHVAEPCLEHADALLPEGRAPDLLGHIMLQPHGFHFALHGQRSTRKRCFSRRARSRMRSMMCSSSSWKKEQPR